MGGPGVVNQNDDGVKGNLSIVHATVGACVILFSNHLERSFPPHGINWRKVLHLLLQARLSRIFGATDAPQRLMLPTRILGQMYNDIGMKWKRTKCGRTYAVPSQALAQ